MMRSTGFQYGKLWRLVAAFAAVSLVLATWQFAANADEKSEEIQGPTEQEIATVQTISSVFHKVAKKATPAVVHIQAKSGVPEAQEEDDAEENGDAEEEKQPDIDELMPNLPEPFKEFFKKHKLPKGFKFRGPRSMPRVGMGSGAIIDSKKGYVLTSNHVVAGAKPENITVFTSDKRKLSVEWVRTDKMTDVALLKLKDTKNLHEIKLGDSSKVEVGHWVLAIGSPFRRSLNKTVTFGIVSAKGREGLALDIDYQDFIQTDAAINPGNSGGPLINLRGEVIGINTAIASNSGGNEGIGFAIPINLVKWVVGQLIEHKEVVRGYLGVGIQSLEDQPGLAKTYGLKEDKGVIISGVAKGSPAAKAGLKVDDVVLAINGKEVKNNKELASRVAMMRPGTKATFKIWRDRKTIEVPVTIGEQPEGFRTRGFLRQFETEDQPSKAEEIETLGINVAPLNQTTGEEYGWEGDEGGVLVTEVEDGSEAEGLGIQKGDLIQSVQGNEIKTVEELRKMTDKKALADGVRMYVKHHRTKSGTTVFLKSR